MLHPKASGLLGILPLLLHQCVADTLPLNARVDNPPITYWVHPRCDSGPLGGKLNDALAEALGTAGRISQSLVMLDGQLQNPVTYERIGELIKIDDRKRSHIRILCDEDDFKPVDGNGDPIEESDLLPEIKNTKYYNEEDDFYNIGAKMCKSGGVAITTDIGALNKGRTPSPDQEPNRWTVTICPRWSKFMTESNMPFKMSDFAKNELSRMFQYRVGHLPMGLLIHELSHVSHLSGQKFTLDTPGGPAEFSVYNCVDEHGPNKISGYYRDSQMERQLMLDRGLEWQELIVNADSYAHLAITYRLREKQWEAYAELENGVKDIKYRKNDQLPDRGD